MYTKYSNIIKITNLLSNLSDYAVIKMADNFPNYVHYDDLDIICRDKKSLMHKVLDMELPVGINKISTVEKGNHIHIDYYIPGNKTLNFRLDLIDSLSYSKFNVNINYINTIIDNSVTKNIGNEAIYVPVNVDDLVIRFFEFLEYPYKKKHYTYVRANITKWNLRDEFIDIILTNTNLTMRVIDDFNI